MFADAAPLHQHRFPKQKQYEAVIPPAGNQELIITEGQSDLELLQQLKELRQVAVGERFGLGQVLFHL